MDFPTDQEIIQMYESGMYANQIAKKYNTYCEKITRILRKHNIKLFHEREDHELPFSVKTSLGI